jgi:hypothetical protein
MFFQSTFGGWSIKNGILLYVHCAFHVKLPLQQLNTLEMRAKIIQKLLVVLMFELVNHPV